MTKKLLNIIFCLFLVISIIAGLSGCCNLANLKGSRDLSEKPGGLFDVSTFTAPDGTAFRFDFFTCVGGKLDKGLNTLEVTDYFVYSTKGDELMLYPLSLSPVMTIDWASPRIFKTKGSPIKYFDEYQPFDGTYEIKFPSEREKDMFDEAAFFGWDVAFNARSETVTPPSFVATAINRNTGPKVPNTVIQKEQYYARI